MNLVIRAQSLNDLPLSQAIEGRFDLKGGTIGRSDTNTMTLPDPERHISRLQAEVRADGAGFAIRNAGAANAIFINGRALAPGEGSALTHGDELRIGGYALGVWAEAVEAAHRTIVPGRPAVDARDVIVGSAAEVRTDPAIVRSRQAPPGAGGPSAPGGGNPFADLMAMPAGGTVPSDLDPFAMLQGAPAWATPPAPTAPTCAPPGTAEPPARLPDDFDPFADLLAPAPPAPFAAGRPGVGAPDLLGSVGAWDGLGASPSIDTHFGLRPPPGRAAEDPLARFFTQATSPDPARPMSGAEAVSTDPMAMFGPDPAAAAPRSPQGPAAFNHTPELQGAYEPPAIVRAAAPRPQPAAAAGPVAPPPARAPQNDALWAAFCEGTGVPLPLPQGLGPDEMRALGSILREAVDGTLRLMAIRATAKTELRAAVTTIRARNNNPLKFSPGVDAAMSQLLQPPLRGFMAGPAAMQDAMHDLVGHSIGTLAGMRAALAGVLSRFEPAQLEGKLVGKSMLDNLLPGSRKAKLWDLYLQHFDAIRTDAHDDFHTLFGAAFVAAYEAQLDQLQPPGG